MKLPFSGSADIICGRSIIILTNLAQLIEGFLTDIVVSHLESNPEADKDKTLDNINLGKLKWKDLILRYDEYFGMKLNEIDTFKSIEILFTFRNNISHGKTYSEQSFRNNDNSILNNSTDKKYEKVRQYLIDSKVIKYEIVSANQPTILEPAVADFFYFEVKKFLFSVINEIEFQKKETLNLQLINSFENCV
ncbi:MAG: hypothetical protein ABL929_11615 [Ferruginibacter sp.]